MKTPRENAGSRGSIWAGTLTALLLFAAPLGAAPLAVGEVFPKLAEFSLEGTLPDTSAAKVVVVDFWASWCTPCRAAFPVLDAAHAEFAAKGVHIIGVSVDQNRAAMESFLQRRPVKFTIVREPAMKLVGRVGAAAMPTTYVLDASGTVRFIHSGFHGDETRDALWSQIKTLLEENL